MMRGVEMVRVAPGMRLRMNSPASTLVAGIVPAGDDQRRRGDPPDDLAVIYVADRLAIGDYLPDRLDRTSRATQATFSARARGSPW